MWTKRVVLLCGLTIATGSFFGVSQELLRSTVASAQSSKRAQADLFELIDRGGTKRAALGLSGGGQEFTYFYLMDQTGKVRMQITVSRDNEAPRIEFFDRTGRRLAAFPAFSPIQPLTSPGGKADNFEAVQAQIDGLKRDLTNLSNQVNALFGFSR
jgi:hypothetical protein